MEKKINCVIFIVFFLIAAVLSGSICYSAGSNAGFDRGIREAGVREVERIAIIEEYERRESERLDREREENRREGERFERTEAAIKSIESLSGGTLSETAKLRAIYSILADEYNSSRDDYFNRYYSNSDNSE